MNSISADPAARGARSGRRLRIDSALPAHAACAVVSTVIVYGPFLAMTARDVVSVVGWADFDLGAFVLRHARQLLIIAVSAFAVAAPFVALATWLGARLRLESWLYYAALGGASATALTFVLAGPPAMAEFEIELSAWRIIPASGAVWGAAWWLLHRRWKADGPAWRR